MSVASPTRKRSGTYSPKEPEEVASKREACEKALLQLPRHLYLSREDLNVAVCSWNVQGCGHGDAPYIARWVQAKRALDVIVLGIQETSASKGTAWADRITKELVPHDFVGVITQHKHGQLICVLALRKHARHIYNTTEAKKRVNRAFSGKGAVAVRFTLYSKRFLFLNCHFDHDLKSSERRNLNYKAVLEEIELVPGREPCDEPTVNLTEFGDFALSQDPSVLPRERSRSTSFSPVRGRSRSSAPASPTRSRGGSSSASPSSSGPDSPTSLHPPASCFGGSTIAKHDYIVWFGDLNYRVEGAPEEVLSLIAKRRFSQILQTDQLRAAMKGGRSERSNFALFPGFTEAPVEFPPTYKFFKGRNDYDCSKRGGTRRVPSYTDRILYRTLPVENSNGAFLGPESNKIAPLKYKSYRDLSLSDHRPIACVVRVAAYSVRPAAVQRVLDLIAVGLGVDEIARLLAEEQNTTVDAEAAVLYGELNLPCDTVIGDGTVYSSDEDEDTMEFKKLRRMHKTVDNMEVLANSGPIGRERKHIEDIANSLEETSGSVAIPCDAHSLYHNQLDALKANNGIFGDTEFAHPVTHGVEFIGEMCANALRRTEQVAARLAENQRHRENTASQYDSTHATELAELDTLLASLQSGLQGIMRRSATARVQRCSHDTIKNNIRHNADINTAYLAGIVVGAKRSNPITTTTTTITPATFQNEGDFGGYEDRIAALDQREKELSEREETARKGLTELAMKEAECNRKTVAEYSRPATPPSDEDEEKARLLAEEVTLLNYRAILSREHLAVTQERAAVESRNAYEAQHLANTENHVAERELLLSLRHLSESDKMTPKKRTKKRPQTTHAFFTPGPGGGGGALRGNGPSSYQRYAGRREEGEGDGGYTAEVSPRTLHGMGRRRRSGSPRSASGSPQEVEAGREKVGAWYPGFVEEGGEDEEEEGESFMSLLHGM